MKISLSTIFLLKCLGDMEAEIFLFERKKNTQFYSYNGQISETYRRRH